MTKTLKLAFAGLVVAVALVTANFSLGTTPSAEAQSPYCAANPALCTPQFCATYPQLCHTVVNPVYPVYPVVHPVYPVHPVTCAPAPYSPVYGQLYRPCVYPQYVAPNVCAYNVYCHVPQVVGPPAKVNVAVSPAIAACGSNVTVTAHVTDALGRVVPNGTGVSFASTMGSIGSSSTIGGTATAVLSIPAGSASGIAHITVRAGAAAASTTIQVNCAPIVQPVVQQVVVQQVVARPAPATVIYQQPVHRPAPQPVIVQRAPQQRAPQRAPQPYVPPFAPPSTGEAGLVDAVNLVLGDDSSANQALIDAYSAYEYGVLDASQYDWVVNPDDSAASVQLASDLVDESYGVIDAAQANISVVADDSAATTSLVMEVLSNPTDYGN